MQTFSERVVKIALSIPSGRVTTYGRIARACSKSRSAERGAGPMALQSITAILGKAWEVRSEHLELRKTLRNSVPRKRKVYSSCKEGKS